MRFSVDTARRRILLVIVAAGLLVRFGVLVKNWNDLELAESFVVQGEIARNILLGNGLVTNNDYMTSTAERWRSEGKLIDLQDMPAPVVETHSPAFLDEPGYGILLAGVWSVFGERWISIRILQILLDACAIALVYASAKRLAGTRAGLLAAGLYALFLPHIELVVRPHRDVWVTFGFIVSVYVLTSLLENRSRKSLAVVAALGAFLGAVAWMRSTAVAYAAFCAVLLFLLLPWRQAFPRAVLLAGMFALVLSPLVLRNYQQFHRFMMTRGAVWHSFWAGIGQFPNPYGVVENDEQIAVHFRAIDSTAVYGTVRYEEVLKQQAMDMMRERPVWYASTAVRRACVILAPKLGKELFFRQPVPEHATGLHNRAGARWALVAVDALLFAGLCAGCWFLRSRWRSVLAAAAPLLYTLATLSPLYVVGRNIMNVNFVTLILAAAAAAVLIDRLRMRSRTRTV